MFNISSFTQEFICAGVRDNVIGMYNFLKEKGVQVKDKQADDLRISSRKSVVLLCTNSNSSNPLNNSISSRELTILPSKIAG